MNLFPGLFRGRAVRSVVLWAPLLLAISGVLGACAADAPLERPLARTIIADVFVSVDNTTSHALSIYVVAGRMEHALGTVPARSLRSFSLPSSVGDSTSSLQLEARDGAATATARSDIFHVSSGQRATWTLGRGRSATVTMR